MNKAAQKRIKPKVERRRHRRARLIAQVSCKAMGREDVFLTRDVSVGGVFIAVKDPYLPESEVAVSFRLKPADSTVSCRGKVVYSIDEVGMGVEFLDLSEEACLALQKFVEEAD